MINALVLSGGGAKGSFEVGAIQYLYSQGFSPDIISGTSVGAINGVKLTEGEDSGKPTRGLAGLLALWLGLKGEQDMYVEVDVLQNLGINLDFALQTFSLRDGGAISASVDAIKNSITNSIFVWPVGFGSIITGILLSHLQSDLSTWFSEIDKAQAFYTLLPLENRARTDSNVLNTEFLQESPIRLFLAMVALETGSLLYADKLGQVFSSKNLKTPIGSTDVVTAVFASAAAPLFFTPRTVMNFTCIDGGTRALIPIRVAVDAGADNIYAINCNAPVPRANIDTLTGIAFRSLDILVDEVGDGNLELCSAGGKVPCIRVVRPGLEIHDALTINPGLIRINIGYGFMRGFDDLELKLTPWARSYARLISDDIATLRKEILNKELAIGQMVPPQQVPPNANAKYIAAIRKMKCQLLWLLQRRHNIYGSQSLPHDYTQWPVVWTNPWENFYGATPWSALKIALGDAKGGHSPHVFAPKQTPCSVGTPLDAGMFPAFHMQQHALPEAHFNIRQPSSGYFLQSTMGKTGNYEVLLPQGNKLVHYFRDNDDPHLRWSLGGVSLPQPVPTKSKVKTTVPIVVQAASMIQSSYRVQGSNGDYAPGNLEVVARTSAPTLKGSTDALSYSSRDGSSLKWSYPVPLKVGNKAIDGVTGNPALIQSRFGGQGNFELVVPRGNNLVHYFRNNDNSKHSWIKVADIIAGGGPTQVKSGGGTGVLLPSAPVGAALMENNFGDPGDFSLVVRMRPPILVSGGDYLSYFRFDSSSKTWKGPVQMLCNNKPIEGVTGNPTLIQSSWGLRGNFELIVPQGEKLVHYYRDNDLLSADDPKAQWIELADLMTLPRPVFGPINSLPSTLPVATLLAALPVSVSLTQSTRGNWGSMCAMVRMHPIWQGDDYLVLYEYEPNVACSGSGAFAPSASYWKGPVPVKLPTNIGDPLTGMD